MGEVSRDNRWDYTYGSYPATIPSPASIYFVLDGIYVPLNLRHRRFIVMVRTSIPNNDVWLKLCRSRVEISLQKATRVASTLANGNIGLPQFASNDVNIQLAQGNTFASGIDYRWSFIKDFGADQGGALDDIPAFAAHTNINVGNEQLVLNKPVIFECDCSITTVFLLTSDGQTGLHAYEWFLACESSNLPQNMYHENHFEPVF